MDKYQNYPVSLGSDFGTKRYLNRILSESEHFSADLFQENTSTSSFEFIDVYKESRGIESSFKSYI
jgi:hypothetical protein